MAGEIDLAAWEPALTADLYPLMARLREQAPACRVVLDGLPAWLITSYDAAACRGVGAVRRLPVTFTA